MNAGSFDDLNIEALVAQEPDLALVGVSSDKGNAQIEEVGIPIYVMLIGWAAIDSLKQEFLNVGKILGNEEKAQRLVDYWNDTKMCIRDSHVDRRIRPLAHADALLTGGNDGEGDADRQGAGLRRAAVPRRRAASADETV